jgi:hypothetical protein
MVFYNFNIMFDVIEYVFLHVYRKINDVDIKYFRVFKHDEIEGI